MQCVLYLRQSLDRSGEGAAISRQEAECRELATRNGWTVVKVYTDNDQSATKGKRPGWTQLLTDLRGGMYDVLVCWHIDRLYRRLRDLVEIVEIAEQRALRIAPVKSADIDLSTPAGRMLAGMLGSVARYEMEQKAARQVAANRARAKEGIVWWTTRPYGYERRGDKITPVEAEAAELRRAAQLLLAGEPSAAIVRDMNRRGLLTAAGKPWTVRTLHRLLVNPRHAGRATHQGEDYGPGTWPAILDPDTVDRVTALLTSPLRKASAAATDAKYLLSGIAHCGRCGSLMYANAAPPTMKRGLYVYRCPKLHLARRLDLTDQRVTDVIILRFSRPDAADLLRPDANLDALRGEVTELRGRRDALARMLADGLFTAEAVRDEAVKLTDRISELERDIMSALGDGPVAELAAADDVHATWEQLGIRRQREVVRTVMTVTILPAGRGVGFDPAQIQIDWLY